MMQHLFSIELSVSSVACMTYLDGAEGNKKVVIGIVIFVE